MLIERRAILEHTQKFSIHIQLKNNNKGVNIIYHRLKIKNK
jgi:hypothetical protein